VDSTFSPIIMSTQNDVASLLQSDALTIGGPQRSTPSAATISVVRVSADGRHTASGDSSGRVTVRNDILLALSPAHA
jgi:hypothetical protein